MTRPLHSRFTSIHPYFCTILLHITDILSISDCIGIGTRMCEHGGFVLDMFEFCSPQLQRVVLLHTIQLVQRRMLHVVGLTRRQGTRMQSFQVPTAVTIALFSTSCFLLLQVCICRSILGLAHTNPQERTRQGNDMRQYILYQYCSAYAVIMIINTTSRYRFSAYNII